MAKKYDIIKGAPTIQEFMGRFKNDKMAEDYILKKLYPFDDIVCPYCGNIDVVYYSNKNKSYWCKHCNATFSLFFGTMFENLNRDCRDWLYIIYASFVSRKSVSSYQLARELHHRPDTIYRFRRRVQAAMANYDLIPFSGKIQIDEAYLGGSNHGRYSKEHEGKGQKKFPVFGILEEESGRVYSYPAIPNEKGQHLTTEQIKTFIHSTCKPGSLIISDEFRGYNFLDKPDSGYKHEKVNHSIYEFKNKNGYLTNRIEGYWSLVKKTYYSTHAYFSRHWAHLYMAECDFRFNHQHWEGAINDILKQSVFVPQVIDIRRMGRFANKTYDLKKYRMILPEEFDDVDLNDITVNDILLCEKPVYGILRESYKTRPSRQCGRDKYPVDWENIGLIRNERKYKDYRKNITNTIEDIQEMIKDATKHKDVTSKYKIERKKSLTYNPKHAEYKRQLRIKTHYESLHPAVKAQIKLEYPNLFRISAKEQTGAINRRMTKLSKMYSKLDLGNI